MNNLNPKMEGMPPDTITLGSSVGRVPKAIRIKSPELSPRQQAPAVAGEVTA